MHLDHPSFVVKFIWEDKPGRFREPDAHRSQAHVLPRRCEPNMMYLFAKIGEWARRTWKWEDEFMLQSVEGVYRDGKVELLEPAPTNAGGRVIITFLPPSTQDEGRQTPQRSIMELRGNGADVWRGVDAAAYVDELRSEWDQRP